MRGLWSIHFIFQIFSQYFINPNVLLHVIDCWRRAIDNGKFTAVAFSDISKSFDSVNHDILLPKLAFYGVLENFLNWFVGYLSCHRQQVCLQEPPSQWGEVSVGVPQGSFLGPLLLVFV